MKHIKILLIAAIALTFSACKKAETVRPQQLSLVSMKVDGVERGSGSDPQPGALVIDGMGVEVGAELNGNKEGVMLLLSSTAVGTYKISGTSDVGAMYFADGMFDINSASGPFTATTNAFIAATGTISITQSTETTLAGTFEFVCSPLGSTNNWKEVTGGTFYITNFKKIKVQ